MNQVSSNEIYGKVQVDSEPDFLQFTFNAPLSYAFFFTSGVLFISWCVGIYNGISQESAVPLVSLLSLPMVIFLIYQCSWMIWGVSYLIVTRTEITMEKELFGKPIRRPRTFSLRKITGIRATLKFFRFFLRVPLDSWLFDKFWGELMFSYTGSTVRFAPHLNSDEVRFVINELRNCRFLNKEQFHSFLG